MRFKKILVLTIAMLMVTLFMTSCGGGGGTEGKTTAYIGLTAPLSGVGGSYGADIKAGLEMAIDKINAGGGVNIGGEDYIFLLKASDDIAVPDQALTNAQGFVLEDGINIIFNPVATTLGPLRGINNKPGEEFLLMAYTSSPLYIGAPNKLYIQGPPPFPTLSKAFTQLARERGYSRAALLQTSGAYGEEWGAAFSADWKAAGGQVVAEVLSSYYTEVDFTPQITKAMAANPDVILCGGPSEATGLLVGQARNLGFKGGFILVDQAKVDVVADMVGWDKMENTIGVIPTDASTAAYMPTFIQQYRDEYGKRVTWETAISYVMFFTLVDSMKIAGSVDDIAAIRAAFNKNSQISPDDYPVACDGIEADVGQLHIPTQFGIVLNGKFQAKEPILWWEQ